MRKKLGLLVAGVVIGGVLLTGCKEKTNSAYYQGQKQAEQAFEVKGNTELDEDKADDSLGLAALEKVNNKEQGQKAQSNQQEGQADRQSNNQAGEVYEYVINTDTMYIHTRDCADVDMKVPTFRRYDKSIDDAIADGYTTCPSCIGWQKGGTKAQ